jgi:hypothetical protein
MQTDNNRWSRAAFRIISDSKSIEEISAIIKSQPTRHYLKGERCSKRNPKSQIREVNLWLLESRLSDQESLQSHIEYFLSFLKDKTDGIKNCKMIVNLILCALIHQQMGREDSH